MARACVGGEDPFAITAPPGFTGQTPEAVCGQFAYYRGAGAASVSGMSCNMTGGSTGTLSQSISRVCGGEEEPETPQPPASAASQTVNVVVSLTATPQPLTQQRVQADLVLWGAILVMLVSIWGAKQIGNFFRTGRYES